MTKVAHLSLSDCPLCSATGGTLVYQGRRFRAIWADQEADFPGFYRLIWQQHVAEFSDLSRADQNHCMAALSVVERVMREQLKPRKINLAALGNLVPHLHWHLVARFDWDSRFPQPIWATAQRPSDPAQLRALLAARPALEAELVCQLTQFEHEES